MIVVLLIALTVLLIACAILGTLILAGRAGQQQATQDGQATQQELTRLVAELKGGHDSIVLVKNQEIVQTKSETTKYRDRVTELETKLKHIDQSLQNISVDAIGRVTTLANTIEPLIAMFKTPQTAGIAYAEATLELLLETHLGAGLYERKPRFLAVGNETVDYVIKLPDCVIPIDSKFPEQLYRQWVEAAEVEGKARWREFRDAILKQLGNVQKYVHPELGTTDYALLFLPTDAVWHQAFVVSKWYGEDNPIPRRAQELRVFGCSAQTLMPYFGLLRLGLRNLRIAEDVRGVQRLIEELGTIWSKFDQDWNTLLGHLQRALNFASNMAGSKGSMSQVKQVVDSLSRHSNEAVVGETEALLQGGLMEESSS